jgi:molecular chaperone GrpE (heat shock protein)
MNMISNFINDNLRDKFSSQPTDENNFFGVSDSERQDGAESGAPANFSETEQSAEFVSAPEDGANVSPGKTPELSGCDNDHPSAGEGIADVLGELRSIREDFEQKMMYDQQKKEEINKLHAELQAYKGDLARSLREPMLIDLIMLGGQLSREIKGYEENGAEPEKMLESFKSVTEYIDDLLKRQGVNIYSSEPGAKFDALRHKGKTKVETNDEAKDQTVVCSQRQGYEFGGRILGKELVDVYVYESGGFEKGAGVAIRLETDGDGKLSLSAEHEGAIVPITILGGMRDE